MRRALAPDGELLVGYVGRLAAEKRVDLLAATSRLPGVRLVVVGDGPARREAERALPDAVFLGERGGDQLARIYASLDVFVHAGPHETFGQTVQEALASGVPVVAPAAGGPLDLVTPGLTGSWCRRATGTRSPRRWPRWPPTRTPAGLRRRRPGAVGGRTWAAIGDELIGHYRGCWPGGRRPAAGGRGVRPGLAAPGRCGRRGRRRVGAVGPVRRRVVRGPGSRRRVGAVAAGLAAAVRAAR